MGQAGATLGTLAEGRVSIFPRGSIHSSSHRHGIRCNSVLPGFIATPMTRKMPEKVKDKVGCGWKAVCQRSLRLLGPVQTVSVADM